MDALGSGMPASVKEVYKTINILSNGLTISVRFSSSPKPTYLKIRMVDLGKERYTVSSNALDQKLMICPHLLSNVEGLLYAKPLVWCQCGG